MKVTSPTDSRRQRLKVRENEDAPLLDGAPPISSGGLHCVDRAIDGLQRRQVFRLLRGLKQDGPASLLSKRRGRPSNHRLPAEVRVIPLDHLLWGQRGAMLLVLTE